MKRLVTISTGESSGELYGSLLSLKLKELYSDVRITGIGGERMEDAGVELIDRIHHAFGIFESLRTAPEVWKTFKRIKEHIEKERPDVLILIDYPDFNIKLGRFARSLGIKVLYYVSPQVWAWRSSRRYIIRDISDFIAVILPFEEEIYKEIGARCEFVGHPVMEEIEEYMRLSSIQKEEGTTTISLLPGSRPSELKRHIPVIEEIVSLSIKRFQRVRFLMPLAPNLDLFSVDDRMQILKDMGVEIMKPFQESKRFSSSVLALSRSCAGVITSGTAALQSAILRVPSAVIYKLHPVTYLLGRLIVKVRYISIPNLISRQEIFKEFLQSGLRAEKVVDYLEEILFNKDKRGDIIRLLEVVSEIFRDKRPSERVAVITGELAGWR